MGVWICLLRPHQWSKNLLIFVPLILSHKFYDPTAVFYAALGFAILCMVSSSTYMINDVADLTSDRLHPTKRDRPLAADKISTKVAFVAAAFLGGGGLLSAFLLKPEFALVVSIYLGTTLAYSFGLKRIPLLDAGLIAIFFTLRIVAGIVVINESWSPWLLSFSIFFFLSLALSKRHTEIVKSNQVTNERLTGRGYQLDDLPLTLSVGIGAGLCGIVIMLIFITNEVIVPTHGNAHYPRPAWLFIIPPLVLFWVLRVWLYAHRGVLSDDPVDFAVRDKISWFIGFLAFVGFALALVE
jgi:4-hydroxybenzoate polyprenyltransferase